MTCIVGIVENGKVYIGGDSAGVDVNDYSLTIRSDPKVFIKGEFIMGFTSSFRMGQLLRYKLMIPFHKPSIDTFEYMVTEFVEAVRDCLRDGGFKTIKNGEETGGTFLVGYKGELFVIQDDFQVAKSTRNFSAIGCGEMIAKGSLYVSQNVTNTHERVLEALKAAEEFSCGVRGPFLVLSN